MTKKQTSIIMGLILVIILLGFMVSGRLWFMIDLTSNKSYTISDVSRNMHREIPNTVKITYYVSDKLKSVMPWPDEIIDLLRLYVSYSRGKIQLSIIDPVKEGMDYRIEQLGIVPREIQSLEQDQASFTIIYSGISIEYMEKTEVMAFVSSLETLEYDITSRIRSMVSNNSRTLGVIIGEIDLEWERDFKYMQFFFTQAGYKIKLIYYGEEIPNDINALFVIGGVETFDEFILYNIDNYIQNGGKVLFAVKSVHISMEQARAREQEDNGLLQMLSHYGVNVIPELVLENSNILLQYQVPQGGAMVTQYQQYPFWLRVSPSKSNPNHPISAGFNELHLYWANPLELNLPEDSKIEVTELLCTGNEAWLMASPYYVSPELDYTYNRDKAKTQGKRTLAVSLSGIFPSYFNIESEGKPSKIIIIEDSYFTASYLELTQANSDININFLIKAADWLGGDDDIMGIRARAASNKLDLLVNDPEREEAAFGTVKTVNVIIMPLLVVITGLFFIMWRRSKTKSQTNEINNEEINNEIKDNEEIENDKIQDKEIQDNEIGGENDF